MDDNKKYREEVEELEERNKNTSLKMSIKEKRNKIVAILVLTLLAGAGLFFGGKSLGLSNNICYIGGGIAVLSFIAMFFIPGDKSEEFKNIPYVKMVDRPDYVFSQLSRQIEDMGEDKL